MSKFDDIINLPHYEPKYHPRMAMKARAAQFAPFAALTGYDAAIDETKQAVEQSFNAKDEDENEEYRLLEAQYYESLRLLEQEDGKRTGQAKEGK